MDIDIIIPIYNAFDFVKKCIETVIEHTDLTQHTLLLVNDKSTDERILPLLNSFIKENQSLNIILIDNKDNQGFVRTVNIGMQYSHHDVVLLNSDTEVTRNWLSKIQNCAYSKPAVATVTPLSNNATLASVPIFLAENTIPPGLSVEEYADIVENKRERDVYGKNYQMFYNPMWNFFGDLNTPHSTCYYDSGGAFNFYKHIFDQVIVSADMVKYFDKDNLKIVTETSSGVLADGKGIPNRKEYSDHLPIVFGIKEDA